MKLRYVVAVAAFGIAAAHAQDKACGSVDSQAAEKALDQVVNWELLYRAFKQHGHCDNALNEDLFTDAFMRLAVEWKHVDQFAKHYQADAKYKAFVQRRMKSLSAKEDVKSLYSRAKSNCPPTLDAFCGEIAEAAKAAM